MPRFLDQKDINFMKQINKELIDQVIETPVIVYKLNVEYSPTNIYGEAPVKKYHIGVQLGALIRRDDKNPTTDGNIIDFNQVSVFSFLRETCQEKNIYPEVGDIIEYDGTYWEINNAAENQLVGDQPFYNWSIICTCHMTRRSALQLDERRITSKNEIL